MIHPAQRLRYDAGMRNRLFHLLVLWALLLGVSARAQDLIIDRALLQDRSGTLTINEVAQAEFTPMGKLLNAGYTASAHWVRLTIQTPEPGQTIELRIRPTFLDEVLLFEPDPAHPSRWRSRATGDSRGETAQERSSAALGFTLTPAATRTTVYLRLQTTSSSLLYAEALSLQAAHAKDVRFHLFLAIYMGFMVWVLFWALNDFVLSRERVVGFFLFFQFFYCVYSLAVMGFLPLLLPQAAASTLDSFTSIMICVASLLGLLFHRTLLTMFAPPRLALRVLDVLIAFSAVVVCLLAWGYTRQALQFNAYVVLMAAPTFMGLAYMARLNAAPGISVIRTLYSLQGLSMLGSMLPFLGWVNAGEWSLQATLMHGVISAFLMFMLLHLRSRAISRQASQAALELVATREQLAAKHLQKQQQERFVAMLTHELKTPIAVIRMALGKLQLADKTQHRVQRALTDMTGIVEHCQQADQLEQQQLVALAEPCQMVQVLDELISASDAPHRLQLHAATLPTVCTDPKLLRIVLGNVLGNSLKYGAPGQAIAITASSGAHEGKIGVRVSVRNAVGSAGLPDASKVFEKYYRSPGARRKTGSGLGLYLVKSYMQLLGGTVHYTVAQGEVEFSIWMPC